jgi:hypothetical protein
MKYWLNEICENNSDADNATDPKCCRADKTGVQ